MRRLPNVYPADNISWPGKTGTFDIGSANEGSKILMRNLTPLNLRLDFYNGSTDTLSAWEHNYWILDGDTQNIGWTIDPDSPSVIAPPSNVVYFTLFEAHEQIPGAYPVFSVLQTSSGSTSGTGGTGTTNQLINTGNPAGQNVITVNSTAAVGSTVTLSTDGLFQLLVTITAALVNAIRTNATDPILQLGALTHLVEVLGNLKVDGTFAVVGISSLDNGNITTNGTGTMAAAAIKSNTFRDNTTGGDQLDLSSTGTKINGLLTLSNGMVIDSTSLATEVDYNVPNTSKHTFEVGGAGARIIDIKSTGIGMYAGKSYQMPSSQGSLTGIKFGAFSPPSGISTITHNFGFVPDIALWQGGNIANSNPGTTTAAIYNVQANTCTINSFAAVPGFLLYLNA